MESCLYIQNHVQQTRLGNKMRTFKLILKGMLLCATTLAVIVFIGGIDSLIETPMRMLLWLLATTILIALCRRTITIRELYKLSGYTYFNRLCK